MFDNGTDAGGMDRRSFLKAAAAGGAFVIGAGGLVVPAWAAGTEKEYTTEIHKSVDMFGTWPPHDLIKLGDYGHMEGKQFIRGGNIANAPFHLKFAVRKSESGSQQHSTKGGVEVHADVQAKATKKAGGGLKIDFTKKYAVFIRMEGITIEAMENPLNLGDRLIDARKKDKGDWKLNYVVVTTVYHAERWFAAVSVDNEGSVSLNAKAPIKGVEVNLKDLTVGAGSKSVEVFNGLTKPGTPLFKLSEIKDPLLGAAKFVDYK